MPLSDSSSWSEKERNLLAELTAVCEANNIDVLINPLTYQIRDLAAIDIEHDEEGNLVGIGVYDGISSFYWTQITGLWDVFKGFDFIAHNGKGDMECLRQWGIPVLDSQLVWDTELVGHIVDSSRKGYGLKKLAKEDLGIEYPSYDDIVGKRMAKIRRTLDQWPIEIVARYNALDTYVTYKLWEKQQKQCVKDREIRYFNDVEKPVSWIFQAMENRGVCVDLPYLRTLKENLEAQKSPIEAEIKNELGDINLNSPKQLIGALHAKDIWPTLKGKASTDKRALANVSHPIVSHLLGYSELETLLSSFVYPYLERNEEIVHPFFNQCGTRTGRPSCSNPNLLQIPRRTENGKLVRRMFIPRDGMVMGDCDFGQIEPRVLAHLSKDPNLCQLFNEGTDFHTFTSERLSISRDRAKILNLSVGYRATFKSVQSQLGGTKDEANTQINNWWNLFPSLRRWQERLIFDAKKSGFCTTILGRRIKVEGLNEGNPWKREAAERQLINNITQGSAAEIMKMAMIKIKQCALHIGILVQVYDELLFESRIDLLESDMRTIKTCMETAIKLDVPLTVDCHTGTSWSECK